MSGNFLPYCPDILRFLSYDLVSSLTLNTCLLLPDGVGFPGKRKER